MAFNYTVPKTWLPTIYIIEIDDPIEGDDPAYLAAGFEPVGIDNLARLHNAKRTAYLQKFKGILMVSSGPPGGAMGIIADVDTAGNTLYCNTDDNSFWKPTVSGNAIVAWTNISKNVIMNVKELQVNDNGDDTDFAALKYDGIDSVLLKNMSGAFIDLRVDTLAFDEAEGFSLIQMNSSDKEMILNFGIKQQSQNGDGRYTVKRFSDATGNAEDDESLLWSESNNRWEFRRQLGSLSNLNIGNILVNTIKKTFAIYTLINGQDDFDLYFNTAPDGGVTSFTGAPLEPDYFYIKHGNYVLRNHLKIRRGKFIIESGNGAVITLDPSIMKPASFRKSIVDIYPLTDGILEQINLSLYLEGGGLAQDHLVRYQRLKKSNLKISLRNATIGKMFFYPTIGEMIIGPASTGDDEVLTFHVAEHRGNRLWIVMDDVLVDELLHGMKKTMVRAVHDVVAENDTVDTTFVYCDKLVFHGLRNNESTFLTTGD